MDSLILQTAIGLVFVFAISAGLVSVITEAVSRYVGLRAEYLLRGLRTLLDGGGTFTLPFWEAVTGRVSSNRTADAAAPVAHEAANSAVQAANRAATTAANASTAAATKSQQATSAAATHTALAARGGATAQAAADASTQADTTAAEAATAAANALRASDAAAAALKAVQSAAALAAVASANRPPALVAQLMAHPLIGVTAHAGQGPGRAGDAPLKNQQRRRLPSYLSGRSFAQALIDVIVPDARGATTMTQIKQSITNIPAGDIPDHLRAALQSMTDTANSDVAAFRTNLEHWYDDQMSRVSGWYKRHTRWVSLALSVVVVLVFNLNVLTIARSIYTDEALRGSVVTQATQASSCGQKDPATCLKDLRGTLASVRGAGLPIGWTTVAPCAGPKTDCNWFEDRGLWVHHGRIWTIQIAELGLLLLGWALMVIALLPGANFWFDILGRLGTLRASGPKPRTT